MAGPSPGNGFFAESGAGPRASKSYPVLPSYESEAAAQKLEKRIVKLKQLQAAACAALVMLSGMQAGVAQAAAAG